MGRLVLQDVFGNAVNIVVFPEGLQVLQKTLRDLGGTKAKLEPGIAIEIIAIPDKRTTEDGSAKNTNERIFNNLCKFSSFPAKPSDLKPKKITMKIPGKKTKIADEELEEIVDKFEEKMAENNIIEEDEVFEISELEFEEKPEIPEEIEESHLT